jgi:hypothetical protein
MVIIIIRLVIANSYALALFDDNTHARYVQNLSEHVVTMQASRQTVHFTM